MTEKLSINVSIIPLNIEHNFLIPMEMNIADATELIIRSVLDEYPETKCSLLKNNMLLQASSGKVLNEKCSLKQLGIIQGEKIILL